MHSYAGDDQTCPLTWLNILLTILLHYVEFNNSNVFNVFWPWRAGIKLSRRSSRKLSYIVQADYLLLPSQRNKKLTDILM